MKALICPNCGAADWKEENGYQICTYCKTKIPLPENEQGNYNIVGSWVSEEDGETDTLVIDENLTGTLMGEFQPHAKTAKDIGLDDCDIDGYIQIVKIKFKLAKNSSSYSILCNYFYVETYDGDVVDSGKMDMYVDVGVLIPSSNNKITHICDGEETIYHKVIDKDVLAYNKNIVGTWVAERSEDTDTLVIDENLEGAMTVKYPPMTIKAKYASPAELFTSLHMKGYVHTVKREISLFNITRNKFSLISPRIRVECKTLFEKEYNYTFEHGEPEKGSVIVLPDNNTIQVNIHNEFGGTFEKVFRKEM